VGDGCSHRGNGADALGDRRQKKGGSGGFLAARKRVVSCPTPSTSNVNFSAGQTRANNAMLGLATGQVDARATVAGGGTVHLVLDVSGYYE
jgi:hypothetical protein